LIVAAQFAIAFGSAYRTKKRRDSHQQKMLTMMAVKYNVPTSEIKAVLAEDPEDAMRYMMDWMSDDKWENRFANFIGLLLKPFAFIAMIASFGQFFFAVAALVGKIPASDAVMYCWFVTAGIFAWEIIFAAIDVIVYGISGRGVGGPAVAQKQFAEVWDRHLAEKEIAERIELDGADWELA